MTCFEVAHGPFMPCKALVCLEVDSVLLASHCVEALPIMTPAVAPLLATNGSHCSQG
jgi:hypothetical protein